MDIKLLKQILNTLPTTADSAISSSEVAARYYPLGLPPTANRTERLRRSVFIRRQLNYLLDQRIIHSVPDRATVREPKTRSERYYARSESVLYYFMDSRIALNVIWANSLMKQLGPIAKVDNTETMARAVKLNEREQLLANKIRIVPDGVGRKYAEITTDVLNQITLAIERNKLIRLKYVRRDSDWRKPVNSNDLYAILGLVAKDGTLYAIACKGQNDPPEHFALHRVERVDVFSQEAPLRRDFDLDMYIDQQHQLAHELRDQESPIDMVLRVAPEARFHFLERPFCSSFGNQTWDKQRDERGWYTLRVRVPFTVQLPPFLWSHAGWVEVLEPSSLRKYVGEQLLAAALHYQTDLRPAL